MTPEERNKYIADCCDGFKRLLLDKADRIPPSWDCAESQQLIMVLVAANPPLLWPARTAYLGQVASL
jgi:hypothetical protein